MDEVLICSECGLSPWDKHCCKCEPCVEKQRTRLRRLITVLEAENAELRRKLDTAVDGSPWFGRWFNADARIAVLEAEVAELRAAYIKSHEPKEDT